LKLDQNSRRGNYEKCHVLGGRESRKHERLKGAQEAGMAETGQEGYEEEDGAAMEGLRLCGNMVKCILRRSKCGNRLEGLSAA
jgi:hypothetical protein